MKKPCEACHNPIRWWQREIRVEASAPGAHTECYHERCFKETFR